MVYLLRTVIFHGYVKEPDGKSHNRLPYKLPEFNAALLGKSSDPLDPNMAPGVWRYSDPQLKTLSC